MRSAAALSLRNTAAGFVLPIAIPVAIVALVLALPAGGAKPKPTITTLSPSDGQTVSGSIKWEVAATDASSVDFEIDGSLRWTEHNAPYVFNGDSGSLDTTALSDGWHTLTATAYPAKTGKGQTGEGQKARTSIQILVANKQTSTEDATSLYELYEFTTNVTEGATITTPFSWTFSPGDPAVKGYFWADGKLLATVDGPGPYTWTLPQGLLTDGSHQLGHSWDTTSGERKSPESAYSVTISNGESAPVNSTLPAISGSPTVGATLTATTGTWTGALPMTYSYQWRRCDSAGSSCAGISGATAADYLVQTADLDKTLRVAVTATNSLGSATAQSEPTAVVQAATTTLGSKLPARLPESSGKGGVYYVDGANGSDSSSGSSTAPWKTINKALASVPLSGSIIKVRPGTYYSSGTSYVINFTRLASTSDPVTLEAETPGTVRIANAQPGEFTLGGWINNASGLRIRGLTFRLGYVEHTNKSGGLPLIQNSDRIEITGCTFYESPEQGIAVRGGANDGDTADDVWIVGNLFRSSSSNVYAKVTGMNSGPDTYFGSKGSHWIYAGQYGANDNWEKRNGSRRLVIANNVFTGSTAGRHVQLGPQARDGFVINNTFFGNHAISVIGETTGARYAAGGVQFFANSSDDDYKTGYNVVTNNLFADLEGHGAYGSGPSEPGNLVQNNLAFNLKNGMGYQGSTSADYLETYGTVCCLFSTAAGNRANADPGFLNPTGFDYRLGAGSPGIGAADPAYSVSFDFTGKLRDGAPDLGAFES